MFFFKYTGFDRKYRIILMPAINIMTECGKGLIHFTGIYLLIGPPASSGLALIPCGGPVSRYSPVECMKPCHILYLTSQVDFKCLF